MSNTTDPELSFVITNVCKPPKSFYFPEIAQPVMFVWFEEFPWACYSCWEDRTDCLPCVSFVLKMWKNPYNKPYQTWKTVKSFKNHQNIVTETHKKRQILIQRFVGE